MTADRIPLNFKVMLGALRPDCDDAREAMAAMAQGDRVVVEIKRTSRASSRMKFYRAMLAAACNVLREQVPGLHANDLHQRMKDEFGLFDDLTFPSGITLRRYKSTAFGKMTEPDFAAYVARVDALLSRWLSCPPGTVIDEAKARASEPAPTDWRNNVLLAG